jgi:hypothetical protein
VTGSRWRLVLGFCIVLCAACSDQSRERRMQVHRQFTQDADAATSKYRGNWDTLRHDMHGRDDEIELLTAAEYLQMYDATNRDAYTRFILDRVKSSDAVVQGSAYAAMSNSTDDATLAALIDHLEDPDGRISGEVATAIENRRATTPPDSAQGRRIHEAYAKVCNDGKPHLSPIERLCKAQAPNPETAAPNYPG